MTWFNALLGCFVMGGLPFSNAIPSPTNPTVEIAPGVRMPWLNLGTWQLANNKPSDPSIGVGPWIQQGGTGLDCAYDYFNQQKVAEAVKATRTPRENLFITTKIPGLGDPMTMIKTDLEQLNVSYVDLVLLHQPLDVPGQWKGLEQALAMNLTRAIGISNFDLNQIEKLLQTATVTPAVNQCDMAVTSHNDKTIAYCQQHNITYEAYGTMKGCPFTDPTILKTAAAHNVSAAQVCLRWVLDRGCVLAVGTGSNTTTVPAYTKEDLDVLKFALTADEIQAINNLQ